MMKNIKLTAFDMDGTLLNDRKELPPDFPAWVKNHPQIRKVIASGRQYYTLRDNMGELRTSFFMWQKMVVLSMKRRRRYIVMRSRQRICVIVWTG